MRSLRFSDPALALGARTQVSLRAKRSNLQQPEGDCFVAALLTRNRCDQGLVGGSCGVVERLKIDGEAELGELPDKTARLGVRRAPIEVVGTEVAMRRIGSQHVIDGGEDGSGDGTDGLLRSAPGFQPLELRHVIAVFPAFGGPCALYEHGLQPRCTLAQTRGFHLACTLVLTGAQPSPGEQMTGGG